VISLPDEAYEASSSGTWCSCPAAVNPGHGDGTVPLPPQSGQSCLVTRLTVVPPHDGQAEALPPVHPAALQAVLPLLWRVKGWPQPLHPEGAAVTCTPVRMVRLLLMVISFPP
jgi:hypothetical protein